MNTRWWVPCILGIALLVPCVSPAGEEDPEAEIQYLLQEVAASGCEFVRNGKSHNSADAADHLRLKYKRGRRYSGTAEQFIDRLASKSSFSGNAYTVTCEGKTEPSRDWLHRALLDYRHRATQG